MGFMAGFGSAFAKSYENAKDRTAQEEQDVFRMKYGDFLDRRKDREKFEREQTKNVNSAKSYAEAYGANPEAWPKIKEWIDAGMTDTEIAKNIQNGDFIVGPTPVAQPDVPNDAASTGDQTKAAMGGAEQGAGATPAPEGVDPATTQATTPPAQEESAGFGWHKPDPMKKANQKIAQLEGITEEEVDKTHNPDTSITSTPSGIIAYKPRPAGTDLTKVNSVADAVTAYELAKESGDPARIRVAENLLKAQQAAKQLDISNAARERAAAEGTLYTPTQATKWQDGQFVEMVSISPDPNDPSKFVTQDGESVDGSNIRPMDTTQTKAWHDVMENTGKDATEYAKATARYVEQAALAKDAIDLAKDPEVVSRVGDFAQIATNIAGDVKGFLGLAQDEQIGINPNGDDVVTPAEFAALDDFEKRAGQALNSGTMDRLQQIAIKRSMLESKVLKMAYMQAADMGQTGQGVGIKELNKMYDSIMIRNSAGFIQVMKGTLATSKNALDQQADLLGEHNHFVSEFKNRFGYQPMPVVEKVDDIMSGSETDIDKTEKTSHGASQAKQLPSNAPEGMKQVGTSSGKAVYEDAKGNRYIDDGE